VPALAWKSAGEVGHPNFQHPARASERAYNLKVDRFPLLLVATALRALTVGGRALWERYDNGDNLLFKETDLLAPAASPLFADLRRLPDTQAQALAGRLMSACEGRLEDVPFLGDLLPEEGPAPARAPAARAPSGLVTADADGPVTPVASATPTAAPDWDFGDSEAVPSVRRPGGRLPPRSWALGGAGAALLVGVAAVGAVFLLARKSPPPNKAPVVAATAAPNLGPPPPESRPKPGSKPPNPAPAQAAPMGPPSRTEPPLAAGEVRRFKSAPWGCMSAAATPDGQLLLGCGGGDELWLWRVSDGKRVYSGHDVPHPWCMAVSPDGRYAAIGTFDGPVVLWDVKNRVKWKSLPGHDLKGHGALVQGVAFSPDSKRVVSVGADHSIRHWDVVTGQEVGRLDLYKGGPPGAVAFSPDGRHFVTAKGVFSATTNKEVARFSGRGRGVFCVAVAPDNRRVVTGGHDNTVRVWDLHTGVELLVLGKHQVVKDDLVDSVAVSPDGRWVLSGGRDGVARLWELDSGREVARYEGHSGHIRAVGFLRTGPFAFTVDREKSGERGVRLWRLPDPAIPTEKAPRPKEPVAFAPGGRIPVSGGARQGDPPPAAPRDARSQAILTNQMKQIVLAHHTFWSVNGNRGPTKPEDLAPYYGNDAKITALLKDGTVVVNWGATLQKMTQGSANTVLGYEKDVPTNGGLVMIADGSVKKMTADQFAKAPKAGK
jgi:hypothetical protein